jgi:hypothetical protein
MCHGGNDEDEAVADKSVSAASRNRNKPDNERIARLFWRFRSVTFSEFSAHK